MDTRVQGGRTLLDVVYELHESRSPAELRDAAMRGLRRTIGCDVATWSWVDPYRHAVSTFVEPEPLPPQFALIAGDVQELPFVRRLMTRPTLEATTVTDDYPGRQWQESFLYQEVCRPSGCEYMIQVALGFEAEGAWQALAGSRPGRDYDDHEREVLGELARHLRQADRRLTQREGQVARAALAAGLTPRQAEALQAVSDGATMRTAATRLGVTPKTLENYLQASYRRLGVNGRLAALATITGR